MTKRVIGVVGGTILLAGLLSVAEAMEFPGPPPGPASGRVNGSEAVLENSVLAMRWRLDDARIRPEVFINKLSTAKLDLRGAELFELAMGDSPMPSSIRLKAADLRLTGRPELVRIAASPLAVRAAERFPGQQLRVRFAPALGGLEIEWNATLRDGSNYFREELTLRAGSAEAEIIEILLLDVPAPGVEVLGLVDGVPAVAGQTFFGYEHPLARMTVSNGRLRGAYAYEGALLPGQGLRQSAVIGVYPAGQQRRGFLYYLERERAHPYRVFLNHNNGEDTGIYWSLLPKDPAAAAQFRANQEEWWRTIIEDVGREVVVKRGARLDSFVHDWNWDDSKLIWQFHNGFPNGFTPARQSAEKFGAALGIWVAPHGEKGVIAGEAKGWGIVLPEAVEYEGHINPSLSPGDANRQMLFTGYGGNIKPSLSLADERYYGRFRAVCAGMIVKFGVNYFKFDGVVKTKSNIDALLRLIRELRALKPDIFVTPSSGTWPSPFWLLDADVTWRGGHDTGQVEKGPDGRQWITLDAERLNNLGIGPRPGGALAQKITKGSPRQQWVTQRDYEVYNSTLGRSPLYPISSLMIHGIEINSGGRVKTFEEPDMVSEIRSFFATGVNHQELFITPKLMTPRTWDVLAEAAKWSRANADVLADTHWVGGDPAKYQVYGWASWSKARAILGLRNPDDRPASFRLDVGQAFELPPGAPTSYRLKSPWKEDSGKPVVGAAAGQPITIALAPFQVLVFEAMPTR